MFQPFLNFVLTVFQMIVSVFQNTDLGGITYESVLVSIFIIMIIVRAVLVIMK